MSAGQTPTKFVNKSITVPADLLADVEEVIGDGNFSAFASDALRLAVQRYHLDQIIADWESENGPIPADQVEARARELAAL